MSGRRKRVAVSDDEEQEQEQRVLPEESKDAEDDTGRKDPKAQQGQSSKQNVPLL